jgi:hypothetical protein
VLEKGACCVKLNVVVKKARLFIAASGVFGRVVRRRRWKMCGR